MNEEETKKISLLEQNREHLLQQKKLFENQLAEVKLAQKEVEATDTCYQLLGNIMVRTNKEKHQKQLQEQQELLSLRLKTLIDHEAKLEAEIKTIKNKK
ncbi:MAG: prefoldin subunit [Candidatus Woesearchaeota archaeon]|nr:MAG: prefoldin subunit [Candidatus Woesearchaeota archaeon]